MLCSGLTTSSYPVEFNNCTLDAQLSMSLFGSHARDERDAPCANMATECINSGGGDSTNRANGTNRLPD